MVIMYIDVHVMKILASLNVLPLYHWILMIVLHIIYLVIKILNMI